MSTSEQTVKTKQDLHPQHSAMTEDENFEEVDLVFTEHELTRKNSWDLVVDQKKHNDEIHDFLHGHKAACPELTVPALALSASKGEVRRYRQRVEKVEMTDFSRERDLEAGILPKTPVKREADASDCAVM